MKARKEKQRLLTFPPSFEKGKQGGKSSPLGVRGN